MGQEIVYCFKCLTRLTGSEFEKGKAFRFGLKVSCKACLPELLATLTPEERKRFQEAPAPSREPQQGISSTRIRLPTSRRRVDEDASAAPAKGKGLVWGLAVVAVVVVAAAVFLLRGDAPAPAPAPTPPPTVDVPKTLPDDARLRKAREAIDRAKRTAAADLDARLALWSEAVKASQGTELHGEALEAEQILIAQRKTMWDREASALQEEARPAIDRGEPAAAAELFEKAKARHPGPEWAQAMAAKIDEVRRGADATYAALKARALAAARKGNAAEVKIAEEAVVRMGYADLTADLRKELAATRPDEKPKPPPPAAPPSAELLAYRAQWPKAVALAVARDFDAAVAEQARLAKDLKEADAQAESASDAEDLARLRGLVAELRRSPRAAGRDVSLEVFDEEGKRRRIQGKVLRASSDRIELAGEPTRFVEFSDLTALALSEALSALRRPVALEQRAIGLLCWAEGDAAAGGRLFAQTPAKVKDLAKDAAARLPKRSEREQEARKLFYAAEREYRDAATRGEGVAKCRRLVAEFADTAIVKGDADLRRRAEEGREYFFGAASLRAGGTFRGQKGEKPESYWGSLEDTDAEKATENFVEFEFLAIAETPYKAWIYAGGCCAEVFGFSWQASDLSGPNPKKPSETIPAAPEGPNHLPVRHGVLYLKPKHADHLGPKSAKRWAWVPLPLPKYPAGGVKRVRLLTNQKGFSVAYAVVSSTRSSPPGDGDLKDLQGRMKESALDLGLLAWWKLDEPAGPTAADSIGTANAQAKGAVEWGAKGKLGGALRLSANNTWLETPHQAGLNCFPITVSAWIQTKSTAANRGLVSKYASGTKNGFLVHLHLGSVRAWYFRDPGSHVWDGADGLNGGPVNDGAWHHVAFVVDAEGGRLFVDGVRKDSRAWAGTAGAPTGTHPVNLGRYPVSGYYDGLIDDVRIYGRALGDAEVLALYGASPAAEAPAPAEARPWKPIYDGKTSSFLGGGSQNVWKVEDGELVRAPGSTDAAQSREEYGDGEFRFRFEATGVESIRFSMRQGADGAYSVAIDDRILATQKTHELIVVCNGDSIQATLNGKTMPIDSNGRPQRGHIQFNCRLGSMKLLSLEMRPLP